MTFFLQSQSKVIFESVILYFEKYQDVIAITLETQWHRIYGRKVHDSHTKSDYHKRDIVALSTFDEIFDSVNEEIEILEEEEQSIVIIICRLVCTNKL